MDNRARVAALLAEVHSEAESVALLRILDAEGFEVSELCAVDDAIFWDSNDVRVEIWHGVTVEAGDLLAQVMSDNVVESLQRALSIAQGRPESALRDIEALLDGSNIAQAGEGSPGVVERVRWALGLLDEARAELSSYEQIANIEDQSEMARSFILAASGVDPREGAR